MGGKYKVISKEVEYSDEFLAKIDVKMSKESYYIYNAIFERLNPKQSHNQNKLIKITINELAKELEDVQSEKFSLEECLETFQREIRFVYKEEAITYNRNDDALVIMSVVEVVRIDHAVGLITFILNSSALPILMSMRKKYPNYLIKDIARIRDSVSKNKYSIVLYKFLSISYKKYLLLRDTTSKVANYLPYKNPIISLETLRKLTNTENDYSRYRNFATRVLQMPLNIINDVSTMKIGYEQVKQGQSAKAIKFILTSKYDAINYTEAIASTALDLRKINRNEHSVLISDFVQIIQNPFTLSLTKLGLLKESEILNVKLMNDLNNNVYPLLKAIVHLQGTQGLQNLINHMRRPEHDYEIVTTYRDVAEKYLDGIELMN